MAVFTLLFCFLAVIGFWQSYFSKLFGDIDSYIHFHAITMMLWVGMLIMVCHEHRLLGDQRLVRAVQKMRVGPSELPYRRKLQTTLSCEG